VQIYLKIVPCILVSPSCSATPADGNVAVGSQAQYVPVLSTAAAWCDNPQWVKRPGDLDLWPFDLESGVCVTCDVGYLCANFSLPRPLCSLDLGPTYATDVRQHHCLMPRLLGTGHTNCLNEVLLFIVGNVPEQS